MESDNKSNNQPDIAIDKQQLALMPTVTFEGNITVIDTHEQADEALQYLSSQKVVGFDTETKPSFKKGQINTVSLMQISTSTHCFLLRLNKLGLSESIKRFLEDEHIIKIGLSLKDDFNVLHRLGEFEPKGFLDLQTYVKHYNISDCSLQKIYAIVFGQRISKSQRLSNWEAPSLTDSQCRYASTDAWACLQIYGCLNDGPFIPHLKADIPESTSPSPQPFAPHNEA